MNKIQVFVAVGADPSVKQRKGEHQPCAYAAVVFDGQTEISLWGYGNFKDTTALYAEAICAALELHLPDGVEAPAEDWATVEIIAPTIGFWERVGTHHDREVKGRAANADQRDIWKKLANLTALFQLSGVTKPNDAREEAHMAKAKRIQAMYAKLACTDVPSNHNGLFREGNSLSSVAA